jgi:UDP-glucose 4-epimerase
VFNLAADKGLRLSEMARIMGKPLLPLPARLSYGLVEILYRLRVIAFGSSQLDYIRYPMSMNTDKIQRELGFSPRYTSRRALELFRDA